MAVLNLAHVTGFATWPESSLCTGVGPELNQPGRDDRVVGPQSRVQRGSAPSVGGVKVGPGFNQQGNDGVPVATHPAPRPGARA